MDFNQILLFASLGLLALVILFALWGFLAGLKRELKCTVVFLVLLVLAWLVFGNSGVLLNLNGGLVDTIRNALNLPAKDATVWETILDYLKSMEGLNLEPLLEEGKETYNLIYNIASAVVSFVLLMGATLVVVIITPIIRLITHIVGLIIKGVKDKKTKDNSDESGDIKDPEADDAVLVLKGAEKSDNAVVTLSENKLPPKEKTKQRVWGAVTGALKCILLIIVLFAPISGIYSIGSSISDPTRDLISDLVDGDSGEKTNVSESTSMTDTVFDIIDAYGNSGIGKFVEGSSYFFGDSFSTLLFDSMANITTEKQHIKIREELIVFIDAVNELNGNIELGTWSNEEVAKLLDTLKDSKLLPEIMPVVIEYASEVPAIKEALMKAVQESSFLTLRDIDWDKDIEKVLDALKHVYALDVFASDLNVLKLDAEEVEKALSILGETELINKLFPIVLKTAIKLEQVENLIGTYTGNLDVNEIDWQKELVSLAHIYKTLQEYGFESIDEITNAELETLVKKLVVEKFDTTVDILEQLVDMSLFNKVIIPVGQTGLNHFLSSEDSEFKDFNNIIKLTSLSVGDWKEDFTSLVEIGKLAVEELNALSLDLKQMDISSDEAILAMQTIVEKVLSLNILGNDKTKNELLLAVFKKFDLFNEEDLYYVEYGTDNRVSILDKVNWSDVEDNIGEITTFKNLIACFGRFANLEYVDIANMQFDFNALLDDEEAVEIIIDALEELVDSELVMQLLSPAVNKYVLPITDKYDDDHLIKDIVNEIGPGTAVTEIAKILQAFKSAQNLGLFKVASKGLSAIEYQKEEDIHNIINTIFDSKLFEGYEGRIIRIVLKATKLLDIEKGLLNDLDYTNEQYILNGFIYILNGKDPSDPDNTSKQTIGILNDPEFQLTDEDGNLSIDIEYFLQPEKFDLLMSGLELILGTFERDENQAFIEKDGSNLIVTLLPNIYDKYGKDLVPAEFSELVDLLGVDDLTGEALASDIRKLVYVARQLVDMDIQTLFVGGSIKYTDKLENMYNIIDALFSVQMIRPNQNAILAWTLNYVGEKLENTIKLEKVTAEQFEGLDLDSEGEIAKEVITNIVKFLEKNEFTTTEELLAFINNQDYLTTNFVTEENATEVINILEGLANLKLLECLSPVFFQALVNRLVENELIEDFWEGNITGKQIMDDLKSILDIAHIAVDDIKFVELWRDNFEGNVAIPSDQPVNKIIDKLFNLNLVSGYEAKLLEFVLGKVLPEDFPVEAEDLGLSEISNWKNEVNVIKTIVESALGILENGEFVLIKDLLEFDFNDTDRIMELVNATNTNYVASVVEALSTSALAGKLIEPGFNYVLDKVVSPMGYNLEFLKDLTSVELLQDLHRIAEALRAFAKHPTLYDLFDPNSSDFDDVEVSEIVKAAKPILVEVGSLNILNKHSSELLSLVLNEVLTMVNLTDIEISADDFVNVKLSEDFVVLTEIIDILYSVLTNYEVTIVSDVMAFVEKVTNDFTIIIENDTLLEVAHVLEKLASMGIIKSILPQAVEYGISIATDNNFDISFLLDVEFTAEELGNDITRLANVVIDLVELHAVDLYNDEVVNYFEKEVVADVVEQLANINLLNKAKGEWASFVVNYLLQTLNIEFIEPINALTFANVNFTEDKELIKAGLVDLVSGIESLFNYTSGGVSIDSIKNFIEYELYLDEASYTDATIKYLFSGLGSILSINVIDAVLPEALRYGLGALNDANIEILENISVDLTNFALGELDLSELTSKELGEFITDLGDVVVALLDFGALEYVNTQDIVDICLAKLLPAIEALAYTPLISNRINGVLALSTTILTNVLNLDVNVEAADFGDVNIENAVEKLGEVLTNGDVLLASLELASIQEIIDFASAINLEELSVRGNIRESAYALVNVLRPLFEIEVLQTVLPKIALFGIKQIPDYDLEFIRVALLNGEVSGYELGTDVLSILDIVELLVEFNAIEIYSNIESGDLDIELKLDIVVEIISIIENLNILKYDYNNWALFISNLFDDSIELDEFASMTNELWTEDFNTLKEIVKNIDQLLSDNDLTTIQSVIDFVQNETYITYQAQYLRNENVNLILDIVENVASINMIDPIIIRLAQSALDQFVIGSDNLPDLYFVSNAIDDEVYMGKDLKDDILVLISILRDLVDFGALDYYCFGEIEEINTELLSHAVEKLETLKLYEISKEQWLIIGINEIFKLLDIETLDRINLDYVDNQFTSIAKVIYDLGQVFDYLNIVSTNDIKVMIEDQMYMDSSYYNEVTLHSIINVLEDVTNIPVLNAIALPLGLWGLQQANVAELEFLTEALERGVERERTSYYSLEEISPLTSPELTQDLQAVVEILRNAVNFGIQDIIYDIRVEELNAEYLENIVSLVANLNVYRKLRAEWLNYGLGMALESLEISVSVEDFEGIASDEEAFKVIVKELCGLVESLDIKCITDAKEFINSEAYYNDFVFGEPLTHVENILTNLVSTNIVNAIYDRLLNYGIGLLENIDISFIEGIYTNDLLVEDISTLVEIVRIAHEFGAVDIIKTKTVGEINLEYVVDALNEVDKLNLLNIARPEWFTLGLNQVYAMLEISDEVEVSDFDGYDVDSEINTLVELVNALDLLMRELELTTYGDIQDFISCQEYLNTTHMNENVFNHIIDALDAATNLAIVKVSISTFATYGMQQANIEELTFFTDALEYGTFTNPELISDIKVLVDILRNAVEFGIVDIIFDVKLDEIKSDSLTNIINGIAELNVYNKLRAEWLGYGLGKALSSIEVEVSAEDFVGIPSDKVSLINAVEALCRLVESLDIMCLTDANNFIENKEYISKEIYTEENFNEIETILTNLISTNIVNAIFDKLLTRGIELLETVDISFVDGVYTHELLVEDIHSLVVIVKNAVQFGALEYIGTNDIEEIDVTYIKNIVAEIENLNLFTLFRAEWVALGLSYVTPGLGIELAVRDLETLTEAEWLEDNASLQEVVMILDDLINELFNPSLNQLIDYYSNFASERDVILTDNCIDIYGNVLSELTTLNTLELIFPNLLILGIEAASQYDISIEFMNELTLAIIHDDVDSLVKVFKNVVHFGLFEYLDTNDIEVVNMEYVKNILAELENLGMYTLFRADWINFALSYISPDFAIEITADDFKALTDEEWLADNATLQQIVMMVNDVITELGNPSLKELIDLYSNLARERDTLLTDGLINVYANMLSEATTLNVFEAIYSKLLSYVIDVAAENGIDITFMSVYSLSHLREDIPALVEIFKNAFHFGLFEYIDTNDIEVVNMEYVKDSIAELENLNIYTLFRAEWVALVLNRVSSRFGIDVFVSDFALVSEDEWKEDNLTLQNVVMILDDLISELYNPTLSELINYYSNFVLERDTLLTSICIEIYGQVLSEVTTLNTLEVIFPKLLEFGISKASEHNLDIEFIETLTLENVHDDVDGLVKIFKNVVFFGLFEYIDTNDIEEVNAIYIKNIIAELDDLNIYRLFRSNWVALVLSRVTPRFGFDVTTEDLDTLTSEEWLADNQTLQQMVMLIDDIVDELDNPTLKELINIYSNYATERDTIFTDNLIDIYGEVLSSATTLNLVELIFPNLLVLVIDAASERNIDISFINALTLAMLHDDVDSLVNVFKNAVHFGLFEYVDTKDIEVVNMEYVKNMVAELENLGIYTSFRSNWIEIVLSYVSPKLFVEVSYADFESLTDAEWLEDNATLQQIVMMVNDIISELGSPSLKELFNLYSNISVERDVLLTDELLDVYVNMLSEATTLNVFEAIYGKLLSYVIDVAAENGIDITFMSVYSLSHLREDIPALVEIFKNAIHFGLFEYIDTNDIEVVNMEYVKDSIAELENLNIYTLFRAEWVALVLNRVSSRFGIDVFVSDFALVSEDEWKEDNLTLQNIVMMVNDIIAEHDSPSLKELVNIYVNYASERDTIFTDNLIDIYGEILSEVTLFNIVEALYPKLLSVVVDKAAVRGLNISFLEGTLTLAHVHDDVDGFVEIFKNVVHFGLFEYLDTNDIEVVNMEYVKDSIAELENLNIYTLFRAEWVARVFNRVSSRFGFNVAVSDFELLTEEEWQADNVALQNMVDVVAQLISEFGTPTLKEFASHYINFRTEAETLLTDDLLDLYADMLSEATSLNMLEIIFPNLLVFAIDKASNQNIDIAFINILTLEHVHEDVDGLVEIVKNIVKFGLFEYVNTSDIEVVNMEYVKDSIAELENLNIYTLFRAEWVALVLNRVTPRFGFDVTASDFASITEEEWQADNVALQNMVDVVTQLINELENPTLKGLVSHYINFRTEAETLLTDDLLDLYADILSEATSLNMLEVIFPNLLVFAIDKASDHNLDIEFINGTVTLDHIHADVDNLIAIAKSIIHFGTLEILLSNTDELVIDVTILNEVITEAGLLETYKLDRENWIATLINFVVARTSYSARVDASDFVGIDWDRENLLLQDIVNSINTLLVNMDLVKYNDIINTVKDVLNKVFVDEYLEQDILEDMLDVADATVNSQIVGALIPMVAEKVINRVKASRGYDLTFVLETTTDEELVEDVHTVISAVRDLVRFNIVRLYLNGTEIDYNEMPLVYSAITKLSGLNVVKGNENSFVRAVFERHDIDAGCLSVGTINGVQEAQTLIEILEVLVEVLKSYDLYTLSEIRHYNYRGIRFDNNTDSNLNTIADIITIIAEDDMFEMVAFALSERYVPTKYNGILDIHNIYSEYNELYTDMLIGADIIRTVANLHLTEIKNGTIDIPFSDTASAESIIRSICNLNYFNLPGRIAQLVSTVDSLYPGKGISYIDGNNIDLASDADKFVEMYNIFAGITTRSDFPIKNRFDINRENISIRYFLQKDILNEIVDMAKVYMDTTVYEETGPVILAILLPIVKVYAPEYWNALDLDNYNVDKIRLDMPVYEKIAKTIKDLDLRGIVSGEIVLDGLDATINSLITDTASLELFKGHLNALTKVLLKDFVYGKHIAGIDINEGTFDIDSVDFDADIEVLKDIITEVFSIINVENIKTLNEFKSYVKGFSTSQFMKNEEAVKDLADIVELAAQSTFVKFNVKQVYTSVVLPRLENMNKAQYVDYRNATNEEIIADLIVIADIIREASTLGLGDVMTGGNINYDQADTVKEILKLIGQMNVVRLSTDAYINYLSTRFEGLRIYGASYETLDIAHDFELAGLAYAEVASALNANFAYRTLSDLRTISLSGLLEFVKNNVNEVVNATEYIAQLSIVPYLVPTVIDRFNSLTSGTVLNNVLATIKPYEVPLSVYSHDATVAVDLVRNLLDSDILSYVVNKSGEIVSAECVKDMIDNIMSLELFKDHYAAIFTQLLTNLSFDVSGYDLTSINYETEAGILADVISEILLAVNEYGLTHYEEIKPELASYKNVYTNEGLKAFLKAVKNALVKINAEHIINVVELIDESEFVDLIIIPIYNTVISIVPESYRTYLELGAYNSDDAAYDGHLVALAIRSLYESEIYKEFTTNEHVGRECVPYLEDVVRYISQLRIIDMKKQDLVNLAGKLLGLDVSALDVSGINIVDDVEILINAMDDVYTAFKGTNNGKFRINMLGDTPTMEAIINVLAALESTTTFEVFVPWIANTYVLPRINTLVNSEELNNVSDEKILSICDDCIDALYALLEMGAFSNDGIDLTNKELTDRVFAVVYNNINLGKYQKYFDKLTRNIASFGILPVDYSVMSTQSEMSAMVAADRELRTLISNYGGQIRALDLSVINNPQFEIDVINVLKQALYSQFISQVFMNIVNGSTMVATENYGKFSMFEGMTNDEFINVALPDIFDIIGYIADLGVLSGTVNYKDTDTIMKLVRKVVESPVTNGHLDELVSLALRKVANIDIDKQVFKDANIDYNLEADYLEAFLNGLDLNSIDITNPNSLKSEQFLSDVSVAGKELIPSKVFGIIIKPVMKKGFEKVGSTNPAVDAFRQTIDSADYTDAMAMDDYEALLEIVGLVANMGIFSGINFDNADNLGTAIKKLFATNLASGNEKVLMEQLLKKMSFVETDNIDLDLVTDWDNEIDKFASMLDALTTLCKNPQFDVDNISSDALNDPTVQDQFVEYVDAASKTYIGSEIFKELYKNNIVPILPADARDIIDIDTLPTDKWAKEIEELLEIYDLVGSSGQLNASSLTANSILSLYDIIFGLNGKDGIESVKNNRKVWLKKFINEDSLLQGSSATLNWDELPDNDQAAQEAEVLAIRAFLNNIITGYVDEPETARISDISYDSIVECKDYNKLYNSFIVMSKSVVMRNVLINTIDTGVSKNSNASSVFNLNRMISQEFKDQVTNGYNSSFWSNDEYFVLAVLLASANAFDLVHSEGIFYMDLGTTYADINTYVNIPGHLSTAVSNFPSQEVETASERKVGFRQILQLMNLSKVFDLGALDGNDGIISELFTINHVRPLGKVENTKEAWDNEINDLTDSFKVLKDAGLLDSNINVSSYLRNEENDNIAELEKLLKAINHSDILRPILAEQMHKALAEAIILAASNSIYNGTIVAQYRDNTKANDLIKTINSWLHQEWGCETSGDPLNPLPTLSDETSYDAKIVDIITLIKNPSSMFTGLLGE